MLSVKKLIKISRPRFWIYIFGPYIVGLVAGASTQADLIDWKTSLFAIFFLFPANILVYGVNDIFDYETDKLNEKKTDYETLVTPEQAKQLSIVILLFNLPFVVASYFFAPHASFALLGFYFFSVFYSASPIRAKTKPFLDSAFNILYIFPGIFVFKLLSGEYPPVQAIVAAGFWTMAMHAYSAIPDIKADQEANISTIATVLGSFGTLFFCLVLYAASSLLAFKYLGPISLSFGLVYALMVLISIWANKSGDVFKIYRYFPLVNALIGLALFWSIALQKFS